MARSTMPAFLARSSPPKEIQEKRRCNAQITLLGYFLGGVADIYSTWFGTLGHSGALDAGISSTEGATPTESGPGWSVVSGKHGVGSTPRISAAGRVSTSWGADQSLPSMACSRQKGLTARLGHVYVTHTVVCVQLCVRHKSIRSKECI